jgi:hypothetical protein
MKKVVFIIQFVFVSQSFALTIDADKILNGKKSAEIQEAITSTQKSCYFQNIAPDIYENDDRKSRAQTIIPNVSGGQHHTFHNSHDEDWIKFFAFSKKKYTIEFRNLEHECHPKLLVYGPEEDELLEQLRQFISGNKTQVDVKKNEPLIETLIRPVYDNEEQIGQVCLTINENSSGIYFLKIINTQDNNGKCSGYDINIFEAVGGISVNLSGYIFDDETDDPIEDATITVTGNENTQAKSKRDGRYLVHIISPVPNTNNVKVEATCYIPKTCTVSFEDLVTTGFDASLSFDNSTCRRIDISDAIIALQILTGFQHSIIIFSDTILGNIDKLGLNDVVRIFHQLNR